jgi:transmembrane sensor
MADFSDIEDFLNDDTFVNWVLTGAGNTYWELFISTYPEKNIILQQAKEIILTLYAAEDINFPTDAAKTWNRIQQTLNSEPSVVDSGDKYGPILRKVLSIGLLSILFFMGAMWYYKSTQPDSYTRFRNEWSSNIDLVERTNPGNKPLNIQLPDGSTVILQHNSKISYPSSFDSLNRTVYLTGEAFFKVKKDKKPFYAHAGELVTRVLGTSFNIKAFEGDSEVVVNVRSGSVKVSATEQQVFRQNLKTKSMILLPNQEVIYNRKAASLNKTLAATPSPVFPASKSLLKEYDDVPVNQLFKILDQIYGINILFNEDDLSTCIITTNLTNQTLFESLEIICSTIGATFHIIDAHIVIESKGCLPNE